MSEKIAQSVGPTSCTCTLISYLLIIIHNLENVMFNGLTGLWVNTNNVSNFLYLIINKLIKSILFAIKRNIHYFWYVLLRNRRRVIVNKFFHFFYVRSIIIFPRRIFDFPEIFYNVWVVMIKSLFNVVHHNPFLVNWISSLKLLHHHPVHNWLDAIPTRFVTNFGNTISSVSR